MFSCILHLISDIIETDHVTSTNESGGAERVDSKPTPEQVERLKDIKDPRFVRRLLTQLAEVADYKKKTCKECNRVVVSIYNLDRHVATQHLGLRECEYSLISKELRRLRTELFGPLKPEDSAEHPHDNGDHLSSAEDNIAASLDSDQPTNLTASRNPVSREESTESDESNAFNELHEQNGTTSALPSTSSKSSAQDSESITERLSAIIRNPNTLKEILTTKEKDPRVEYQLDDLIDIQRQILDAADPYLQCCRLCKFDVSHFYTQPKFLLKLKL